MKRQQDHPESAILDNLLGEIDGVARASLARHLSRCAECRALEVEWREALSRTATTPEPRTATCPGALAARLAWRMRRPRRVARLVRPGEGAPDREAEGTLLAQADGSVRLMARGLSPLPIGQVYVLWVRSDPCWRNVAAFAVDAAGIGVASILGPRHGRGQRVLVTAEAHANEGAPTGPARLVGQWP